MRPVPSLDIGVYGRAVSTHHKSSPLFEAWGRLLLKYRWPFLLLIVVLTTGAVAVGLERARIDNSVESFAPQDTELLRTLETYRGSFGRNEPFLVLVEGPVYTKDFLSRLQVLHQALADIDAPVDILAPETTTESTLVPDSDDPDFADLDLEGFGDEETWDDEEDWGDEGSTAIQEVLSLVNVQQVEHAPDGLRVQRLLEPIITEAQLPYIAEKAQSDPRIVGQLVGKAGQHTLLVVRTHLMSAEDTERVYGVLEQVVEAHNAPGFKGAVTGPLAITSEVNRMVLNDLIRLPLFAAILMLIALYLLFPFPVAVIGPVVVVLIAVLWTLGFMAWTDMPLSLLTGILPAFLVCVGVGDSIHLQSIYRDLRRQGTDNSTAIIQACGITGPPIFFTSVTTMIGLFSLQFATVNAIVELGIAGAFGVACALVCSLILIPILLHWNRSTRWTYGASTDSWIPKALARVVALSDNRLGPWRRATVLWFSLGLTVLSVYGATLLEVRHDDLETLPEKATIRSTVEQMDTHVSGVASAQLVISAAGPHGVQDIDLLHRIEALEKHVLAYQEPGSHEQPVQSAISLLDIVRSARRALRNQPELHDLPDTQEEASQLIELFELQDREHRLRQLVTLDRSRMHLTFRVKWREATGYGPLVDHIEEGIQKHIPEDATAAPTGSIHMAYVIVTALIGDLLQSFGTAFIVITVLMIGMLRSIKLGLLAMVPNLLPILVILGLMGLANIPLDLNNLLIASIALGIAVDDTIHLLHHFQSAYRRSGDVEKAINEAMDFAGRAMVNTSLLLAAGFVVYVAASNIAVQRFGLLTSGTVVIALLIDILLCPALLRTFYRSQPVSDVGVALR